MKLRTAGLIVGWLGLVASVITISCKIHRLTQYELYQHENENETISNYDDNNFEEEQHQRSYIRDVIFLSTSIINGVVTAMLINGIMSNKHRFLLPWLIVKGSTLIIVIPLGLLIFIGASLSNEPNHITASTVILLVIGVCSWCWLAIYSLYKEMRGNKTNQLTYFENAAKNGETVPYQLFEKY